MSNLEAQFRRILENLEDVIWLTPPDKSEMTYVNPAHEDVWGRSREQLYEEPLSFLDGIHPDDRDRVRRALSTQTEGEYDETYRVVQPDGEVRWVRDRAFPITDEDDEIVQIAGIAEDITEQKAFQQALRTLNETAQRLLEAETRTEIADVAVTTTADVFDLPCVAYYSGADDADALRPEAHTVKSDFPGQQFQALSPDGGSLLAQVYEDGDPYEFEAASEPADVEVNTSDAAMRSGLYVPIGDDGILVAGACDPDAIDDRWRQLVEILAAIVEAAFDRLEREQYFREATARLEAATEAGAVGTWEWHVQEDEMITGRWFADVFDVDPEAAQEGVSLDRFVDSIHDADRERVAAAIEEALETCGEYEAEYRVWDADGSMRWVNARGHVECDEDGTPVRFPGALTDITERKTYQQELEASNERLEQFAYAASHDLQEPLRMISSYLQLLEGRYGDALEDDGEEFLQFAVDGAERMRAMVDGLLEYSRVDTHGEPFEPVDLDQVLEDVLADLHLQIEESDADITVEDLPRVHGDENQLRQLFQNLLENAITYSGDEPPQVEVTAEPHRGKWLLAVEDEGVGIDPEDADRVFEVFERLHSREEYSGTGIGLALCERIVDRHGGDIWLESEPGEGTTVLLTLSPASYGNKSH